MIDLRRIRDIRNPGAIDRFGGPGAVIVAAIGLVVLAGFDQFLLPGWVAFGDTPRAFWDLCTDSATTRSGGFGVLLLAMSALLVAALSLVAPRRFNVGLALGIFFVLLQFALVNSGGLTVALDSAWITWLTEWEISCGGSILGRDGVALLDHLQQYYNPGDGGAGDVTIEFTNMLALNLALGLIAALPLIVIGAVMQLFGFVRGKSGEPATEEDAPLSGLFRGPERTILAQSTAAVIALMIIGPILLVRSQNPEANTTGIEDLLWIGPFIVLLDLARLMLVGPKLSDPAPFAETEPVELPSRERILKALAGRLQGDFATSHERLIEVPPISDIAAPDVAPGPDVPGQGKGRYILGTLKAQNYDEVLACLNEGVLDRGRTALVVCPDAPLITFSNDIITRLAEKQPNIAPRTWLANTELEEEDGPLDLIFASPETLGTVLDKIEIIKSEIATLGGVIVIGMHRMDVGLLSLGMRRLKPFVENPATMIGVAQSEEMGNARDFIGLLPLFSELEDEAPTKIDLDRIGPSFTLLLCQRDMSSFERREDWPDWVKVLWRARQLQPRAEIYLFDTEADHPALLWRDRVVADVDGEYDADVVAWGRSLQTPSVFPINAPHPAAVIKDRGNLADALRMSIADTDAVENLRIVTTGDYPGSSFLRARLHTELGASREAVDNKRALARFCKTYGSYLPKPQGGPIELALLVHQEYRSTMRRTFGRGGEKSTLSQDGLDKIWAEREEPLHELGISNTRVGIERLFRQAFLVQSSASFVTREESADRRWSYDLTATSLANPDSLATYALELDQKSALPGTTERGVHRLIAADHGLTYAEGTRVSAGGGLYVIRSVNPALKTVLVAPENSMEPRGLTFVRDYAIRVRSDDPTQQFAADTRRAVQDTAQAFEIAIGYARVARRTTAFLEHGTSRTPLGDEGATPRRADTAILSDYRLRSIAVMRLYQSAVGAGGGAARPGGGRVFGRGAARTAKGTPSVGMEGSAQAKVAFTLITTLQDVLQLMFPPLAHRIAVVSHDAVVLPPVNSVTFDKVTGYCLERQPTLARATKEQPFQAGDRDVLNRHLHSQDVRLEYDTFVEAFLNQARARDKVAPEMRSPLLTLVVLEDSDHDLGVARFLNTNFREVQAYWQDYLEHYADAWRRREAHDYEFGAGSRPSCYDFQAAFDIVKGMA